MQRIKNTIFVIDKSSTIKTYNISHFEDEAKIPSYRPQPFVTAQIHAPTQNE